MYALGTAPAREDTQLHEELCAILGTHVPLVLLDAQSMRWTAWHRQDAAWLPTVIDVRPDPTEQVVLEDAVGVASYTDELGSVAHQDVQRQLQSLTSERRSVAALYDRLVAACAYMERARHDPAAYDATTLRHLATAVAHRAPKRTGAGAPPDASVDALLAAYLAAASKNLHTLDDVRDACLTQLAGLRTIGAQAPAPSEAQRAPAPR